MRERKQREVPYSNYNPHFKKTAWILQYENLFHFSLILSQVGTPLPMLDPPYDFLDRASHALTCRSFPVFYYQLPK